MNMVTEITMQDMLISLPISENTIRVVMFFGAGCGPCKATMPHYEAVSTMFESLPIDIKFFRINAWEPAEQKQFVEDVYGINGVPHFKVFFKGELLTEKIGGGDEPALRSFIYSTIEELFKRYGVKNES